MDKQPLKQAIGASLEYILTRQSDDGSWVDWDLPPGPSDIWTTAFVGCKLTSVDIGQNPKVNSAIRAASKWLLSSVLDDAGWGYNASVGSDADSTAHAILLLSSQRHTVSEDSYARLRQFQCPDGGFSTYCADGQKNSWVVSHPDVSPVVLQALLTKYSRNEPFVARGVEYVLRQRTAGGVWNSFWWNSFLYSTDANLSLLNALDVRIDTASTEGCLRDLITRNAFEAALHLGIILCLDAKGKEAKTHRLVEQLVGEQQPDGSWKSEPILRVTERDCFEPWKAVNPGREFADPNRLFTTSTVIGALSGAYLSSAIIPYAPIHTLK